jgi:O-antigen ligase
MKQLLNERAPEGVSYDFGHVHNNLIQIGVNWGVPGLLIALWFFFAVLRRLFGVWRAHRDGRGDPLVAAWALGGFVAWIGFHFAGVFEWYFGDAEMMATLFVVTGTALAVPRDDSPQSA